MIGETSKVYVILLAKLSSERIGINTLTKLYVINAVLSTIDGFHVYLAAFSGNLLIQKR